MSDDVLRKALRELQRVGISPVQLAVEYVTGAPAEEKQARLEEVARAVTSHPGLLLGGDAVEVAGTLDDRLPEVALTDHSNKTCAIWVGHSQLKAQASASKDKREAQLVLMNSCGGFCFERVAVQTRQGVVSFDTFEEDVQSVSITVRGKSGEEPDFLWRALGWAAARMRERLS